MKRGRKPVNRRPQMEEGLPTDLYFSKKCGEYLDSYTAPDPPFVFDLMERYLDLVSSRQLTGPEIAASVEHSMIRYGGTLEDWFQVLAISLGAHSAEAVKQNYKRHKTGTAEDLEAARAVYLKEEQDRHSRDCKRDACAVCGPKRRDLEEKYRQFRQLLTDLFGYQ